MHELSLAEMLLEPVLAIAEEHRATVTEVVVQAGALQQIVPESLRLAFAALTDGTAAAGATLTIEPVTARGRCRRCELEFDVDDLLWICPDCGLADVTTIAGNELTLVRLELEPCESMSSITS